MKAWIGAVAIVGSVASGAVIAKAQDGNELLSQCQNVIRANPNAEASEALDAGLCLGLVQGVRQTMAIYAEVLPREERTCIPEGMTNGQGVRVVVKYLEDHPKTLHYAATVLTMAAYRDAYPCKK